MHWKSLVLLPKMGMLAHIPKIADVILMSCQGINYITYAT